MHTSKLLIAQGTKQKSNVAFILGNEEVKKV